MEFEPIIPAGFEPRVQIGLNPFEPGCSNRINRSLIRGLTRDLLRELTVLYNNTARTTSRYVARAEWLVCKTAIAQVVLSRRKGGSK
jgi:hypothetical protein